MRRLAVAAGRDVFAACDHEPSETVEHSGDFASRKWWNDERDEADPSEGVGVCRVDTHTEGVAYDFSRRGDANEG